MGFTRLALPSRFEVVRRIGEGGMGVVYEALDLERHERVALKTILHHDADTVARVKHEFRALQDIHHPNLVTLRELVAEADDVFFTMDLVEGVDLRTWICGESRRGGSLSGPTAVDVRPEADPDTLVDMAPWPHTPASGVELRPPREPRRFDEARLRDAFRQVALGLSALHAAGKVHRDVKPSNVRVTAGGRVVLLDFGLVFEVDARQLTEGVVGTPAYMAPEQATSAPVGPAADWYAVGVMLYECLTGRRPFEGAPDLVLANKHFVEPLPPGRIVDGLPPDLEELCAALLRVEPRARPSGEEVLRRLHARTSERPRSVEAPFVGRDDELEVLRRAFADVESGGTVTVTLHGESGVGKSCLVRRFVEKELEGRDDVVMLTGRCYEREAVPYKALDEIIEALSRKLARLPRAELQAILPQDAATLSLVFPAMSRVASLEGRGSVPDRDPLERRRAAFRALRSLLVALSRTKIVVATIDDLQWTDDDSMTLLQEVLRSPGAPRLLLVATLRDGGDGESATPTLTTSLPGDVRVVRVGRLAKDEAERLAQVLLARAAGRRPRDATAIAAEADGHPMFIDELVRHAALAAAERTGSLRLDEALLQRAARLDGPSRRVLDVACLLGAPVGHDVIAQAAGVDMSELTRCVSLLRATHFLRTDGARVADAIEPFHDRVREAVVWNLDADARQRAHARIAEALEVAKASDPEVLATHWGGAGDQAKAARYTLIAAEQAAAALAFHRSARLFEKALALLPETDARRRAVHEHLGDALASAGDGKNAAAAYERAAAMAGASEAIELRRRAAEQLLRVGETERGLRVARDVLAAVDLSIPTSTLGAIVTLVWLRLRLWLRGLRFVPRSVRDIAPSELTRIDICWSVSFTLPVADPLAAGICHARHVLLALQVGEPTRVARALGMEASYAVSMRFDDWPKAARVLEVAKEAARIAKDPYADAIVLALQGVAESAAMRFEEAIADLTEGVARFRKHIPGSTFEVTTAQFFLFVTMGYTARYGELRPGQEEAVAAAVERGDRYAAVMLRLGVLNSTWLFAGDPARALREIEAAEAVIRDDRFRGVHYQAFVARSYYDIYEGELERAYERLRATTPLMRRAFILQLQAYRTEVAAIRARLALGCAKRAAGARREALLREASSLAPMLGRMSGALGRVNPRLVRANVAMLRGDRDEALAVVREMADDQDPDAFLSRTSARVLLGRLTNDRAMAEAAIEAMKARGGASTPGIHRVSFPGFDDFC